MSNKMILSDVQAVFYKIIHAEKEDKKIEDKRFRDFSLAKRVADEHKGKVVRVKKRILETMEFELALKTDA